MSVADRDEDVSRIGDLIFVLWNRRFLLLAIAAVVVLAVGIYAVTATKWYRSEILLLPSSQNDADGLSGQFGSLGGLIDIAGFGTTKSSVAEAIALLQSKNFTNRFLEDRNLLPTLFSDDWDEESGSWSSDDPAEWPDVRDGTRYFARKIRSVSKDPQTGLVTLGIEWTDPQQAADWANSLVNRLNAEMRQKAIENATTNIEFLESQLESTNVAQLRRSISSLLEAELEKLMLAKGDEQFAFTVLDPAEVPKKHERPRAVYLLAAGVFFGLAFATLVVLFVSSVSGRRAD